MRKGNWRLAALGLSLWTGTALAAPPAPPLDVYGGLPGVEEMAISPSGGGLAIVGRHKDARQLLVLDKDKKLRSATPLLDMKLRSLRWVGEDMVMIVTSVTEALGIEFASSKLETYHAITVPLGDRRPQAVFEKRPAIAKAVFGQYGVRQVDGKWLGYFGGIELSSSGDRMHYVFDHGRPALFSVDLANHSTSKIAKPPTESVWRDWAIDAGGKVAATLDLNHETGRWQIVNAGGKPIVTGTDPTGAVSLICFGKDGSTLVYSIEDKQSGLTRWLEVPLSGGTAAEILAEVDIDQLYIDKMSGRMLGYLEGGAPPRPVLFDPAQKAALGKVYRAFPKLHVDIVEWTPDFSHVLAHTSGNGDSGTWYIVDLAARRADPAGYDYPVIPPDAVGPISRVAYAAADGLAMDGILTLPPGREAKNLPVIMLPHGGPHAHDEAEFDWWAQAFASRGYAVFQPNFRGSTNRDDAFRRAGYGQWGRKMQTDISDGLATLAKQGIVDPKRACIVGASYGGYAALAGVTLQQGLYRCAVAVAPVSDLADMYWTDYRESGSNKAVKQSMNESLGSPGTFAAVSPRRNAAKANAPILLVHGKDDTVVPFKQSTAMADALKDAGKPYEMVVLREEDHWLSRSATRKQMLEAAVGFVGKHNPAD